jgi:hypothetical protein
MALLAELMGKLGEIAGKPFILGNAAQQNIDHLMDFSVR